MSIHRPSRHPAPRSCWSFAGCCAAHPTLTNTCPALPICDPRRSLPRIRVELRASLHITSTLAALSKPFSSDLYSKLSSRSSYKCGPEHLQQGSSLSTSQGEEWP